MCSYEWNPAMPMLVLVHYELTLTRYLAFVLALLQREAVHDLWAVRGVPWPETVCAQKPRKLSSHGVTVAMPFLLLSAQRTQKITLSWVDDTARVEPSTVTCGTRCRKCAWVRAISNVTNEHYLLLKFVQ